MDIMIFQNNWINDVRFKSSLLTDHFDAKENSGKLKLTFLNTICHFWKKIPKSMQI